jgi:hypothetical protein
MKQFVPAALFFAVAFAGLAMPVVAKAQAVSDSPLAFANADKNHDGFMSRSEVPKDLHDLRAHFDQYDQNHDHRLSEGEYGDFLTAMVAGACHSNLQGAKNPNCQGMPGAMGGIDRTVNTNSDRTSNKH